MKPSPRDATVGPSIFERTSNMQTTGELIRLMNYVDDISATLRRIHSSMPTLTPEDRKRLAEYFRKSDPNVLGVLEMLDRE